MTVKLDQAVYGTAGRLALGHLAEHAVSSAATGARGRSPAGGSAGARRSAPCPDGSALVGEEVTDVGGERLRVLHGHEGPAVFEFGPSREVWSRSARRRIVMSWVWESRTASGTSLLGCELRRPTGRSSAGRPSRRSVQPEVDPQLARQAVELGHGEQAPTLQQPTPSDRL